MSSLKSFVVIAAVVGLVASLSACISVPSSEPTEPGVEMDRAKLPPGPADPGQVANPAARAVDSLIADSQREYDRGEWQAAIATAERALRIDRRQPDIYLIIAKSYRALGDIRQAQQFVDQGLRYVVDDTSPPARELNWLSQTLSK